MSLFNTWFGLDGADTSNVVARSFIASLAFNRRYVTRDGCFQDGLGIIRDDAVEVVSVDRLEREWLEYSADVFDGVPTTE